MANPLKKLLPKRFRREGVTIPVVKLSGMIAASSSPFRQGLSIATAAPLLEKAFGDKAAPAVAIVVNSPGGSPVQSRLIFKRIRDLAEEKQKTVLVFVEDVAASGGYMIACAGDEIIADPSSIVGSIGVVSGSFGFVEAIAKLGIERRVHTAGQNKATLDPFQPEKPEDVAHLKALQLEVHDTFIDLVKSRRGAKLVEDDQMFSGLFWSGKRGLDLGLVDALGDIRETLRLRYGETVKLDLISQGRSLFGRKPKGISAGTDGALAAIGEGVADRIFAQLEERAIWARFGL
ncbi:S49 family peptidase [Jiella avicenniae]|uniref:S49 family peptidase n=1 Tax=Jiella avicenniae TaxID=2907202 RepID=A0A9X1P225_9HYPH|nr:S49 family peptidase [Jiella avicenniae]MCE7027669.1 S49 family peptidase [Jiella avicenniae]MCE7028711.1 S49 family peptidase [Jiella avicenniae]